MPPTRSGSSRSKKRPSAVDILNNVMSGKDSAADSRQVQSAQPVRQLRNIPRAPRRDIWEVPNSPEPAQRTYSQSSPLADAEPFTPRRSTRLQNVAQVQSSPTMARTRAKRTQIEHVESNVEDGDSWHPSQEPSSDESDNGAEELVGDDIDFYGNFNVFSDDTPRTRSSSTKSPTPSAALRQDLERVEQARVARSESGTPSRVIELRSGKKRDTLPRWTRSTRSTRSAAEPGPSIVINRSPSKVRETPVPNRKRRSSRLLRSEAQDVDGDVEMGDHVSGRVNGHQDAADEDTGSAYTASNSNEPSSEADTPSLPYTRAGKLRRPPRPSPAESRKSGSGRIFSWSPTPESSSNASAAPQESNRQEGESENRSSLVQVSRAEPSGFRWTPGARRPKKRSRRRVVFSQKTPEQESPYPRFKEAMEIGQQQENWKALIKEARLMERPTNPTLAKRFQDILDLISHSQKWYESLPDDPDTSQGLSLKEAGKSEKLLDSISTEGDAILDRVFYRVTKRNESSQERGLKLFREFEVRVIPAMVRLLFAIFDAYHTDPERFALVYNHLHRALSLVLRFCNRMRSLTREQYVRCTTRSKNLLQPLRSLIEASEFDSLKKAEPEPEPETESESSSSDSVISIASDDDVASAPASTIRQFSDAEGRALLDGLQQFQGRERYIQILKNFSELEGRTLSEIREESRRMCDKYEPLIRDELRTPEGREPWRWLLSVWDQAS
ncbi:hypothetical protein ASPCAL08583 [Aspergillus calidoustus]|uniref:Uncharacterized protein n=1 Tax=Aspergillus calidoustus TaxID=454130 RepID=A0A0U5GVP5_ASPCI|nr:hypothetical protein ASPCAL08583 [Aspergillus calidoustus]